MPPVNMTGLIAAGPGSGMLPSFRGAGMAVDAVAMEKTAGRSRVTAPAIVRGASQLLNTSALAETTESIANGLEIVWVPWAISSPPLNVTVFELEPNGDEFQKATVTKLVPSPTVVGPVYAFPPPMLLKMNAPELLPPPELRRVREP